MIFPPAEGIPLLMPLMECRYVLAKLLRIVLVLKGKLNQCYNRLEIRLKMGSLSHNSSYEIFMLGSRVKKELKIL